MHLRAIEQEKSKADDAFSRGALSDAAASLEAIEAAYQRLGFHEGLATLRYNRLLMAVEADERAELPRVGRALSETLRCLEPPATPLILQVAAGLKRLLASSVRGLDAALEAELLELAAWLGGDALEAEATTSSREWPTLPTREASTLGAEDAARVLSQSAGAGLLAGLGATEAPPALALTALEAARVAALAGNVEQQYIELVRAFELTAPREPRTALDIQASLNVLESGTLPPSLDYRSTLPRERRLRVAADLHARIARVVARQAGSESVAAVQWRHVESVATAALGHAAARRDRGALQTDDGEHEAQLTLMVAEARRALGHVSEGLAYLEPFIARARRGAFGRRETSVRVLSGYAEFQERLGRLDEAAEAWREAAELALPGACGSRRPMVLAQIVGDAMDEGLVDCVVLGAIALAGVARTRDVDEPEHARLVLGAAHTLMSFARRDLDPADFGHAMLWIELSLARFGDAVAAGRARELARARQDPEALALGGLLQALTTPTADTPQGRRAARAAFVQVALESVRATAGAVRRATELCAAHACRAIAVETVADWSRVEVHLRRYAEAARPGAFLDGAGPWDLCLPTTLPTTRDALLDALVDAGRVAAVHRSLTTSRLGELAPQTPPALAADEAHLEFHPRFAEVWVFVRVADLPLTLVRIGEPVAGVDARVDELLEALTLRGEDARREVQQRAQAVFRALVAPCIGALSGVTRLVVTATGSLARVPFGVLLGDQFLCERFDIARTFAAPQAASPRETADREPRRLVVLGDAVTSRDLGLCELERDGVWSAVHIVSDAEDLHDEAHDARLAGARCVHLVGAVAARSVELREGHPASLQALGARLRRAGVAVVVLDGPVDGPEADAALSALIEGGCDAVIVRRWAGDEDGTFLRELVRACARAEAAADVTRALAETRRAAVIARLPARAWMAYEVFERERA